MAAGQDPIVWVTAAIPRPLMAALQQRGGVPHQVRLEVDRQLRAGVQPQVIRDRLERRWFLRYSNLTGRDLLERADGIALEIVEPPACPAQRCEDGQLLDDSGSCPVCRPNGTTVNFTGSDRGERATPAAYQRAAAGIRSRLREGHRSLQAAEERARAEGGHAVVERDERGRRVPVTMLCAGCGEVGVPALRWEGRPYCSPCLGQCRGCSKVHPLRVLDDGRLCPECQP
jgi:hypothetical protein